MPRDETISNSENIFNDQSQVRSDNYSVGCSEILRNLHPLSLGSVVMLWDVHVLITSVCAASRDLIWVISVSVVSLQGLELPMGNELIGAYMGL